MSKTNTKSIRISPQSDAELKKLYGSAYAGGTRATEAFLWLRRYTLKGLKGKLTRDELSALTDIQNGLIFEEQFAVNHYAFVAHIEDSDWFDHIGERWQVDVKALIKKVEQMTTCEIFFLQEEIDRFWNVESALGSPNSNLEKFLDTLT